MYRRVKIKGLEKNYTIDTEGIVRNKKDKVMKIQYLNNYGSIAQPYVAFTTAEGKSRRKRVAWLVAEAFIDNPNKYEHVAHLNYDIKDNRVENLAWSEYCQGDMQTGCDKYIPGTGTFKKGEHRGKSTEFKKGNLPKNWVPIGTEAKKCDGYIYIKVNDIKNKDYRVNWKRKSDILWEEAHGPIPKGKRLLHLDGNREHVTLDNLVLVDQADVLLLIRNGLISCDKEITESGLTIVRLIREISKKAKKLEGD